VGARMGSSGGRTAIQAPLGRRDTPYSPSRSPARSSFQSRPDVSGRPELAEYVLISLDTFFDRRTAYSFGVTASGVRIDHQHLSDSEFDIDPRFDPVWEASAQIDDTGWTAEMWIPFEQLRFDQNLEMTWGLNVHRWIPLKNEDDYWVAIPRTDDAWSSRFGTLRGIGSVEQGRRLEVLPYAAVGSTLTANRDPLDPFVDELNLEGNVGADVKMGLGSNLTLDATFFPDFGQVEVDPAVINLTDIETFYPERRPFFTEGAALLEGFETNYFYSRRVGGPPLGSASGDFVDIPGETTILGAGKLTGRLPSGTSLGVLAAVTGEEHARTFDFDPGSSTTGTIDEVKVTPRTTWGLARIQQEFGDAGSTAAIMLSGVHRSMDDGDPLASLLRRNAWMGGGDLRWRLAGGAYEVLVSGGLTGVDGEEAAIVRAQRGSERYFQRPDADHVEVDSSRTSLSGFKATLQARRLSGAHWLWDAFLDFESPEVTFNDIGRLGSGDGIMTRQSLTYRETAPGRRLRGYSFTMSHNSEWNFGGGKQHTRLSANSQLTLNNFWSVRASGSYAFRAQNQRLTRGGPSMQAPEDWSASLSVGSNPSAQTRWNVGTSYGRDELDGWSARVNAGVSLVPAPRWQLSLTPSFERQVDPRQYVTSRGGGSAATYGGRYIFAFIDRTTLALETRLNFTLQPDLNLELYAQPFAASGRYYDVGELAQASALDLRTYGTGGTTIVRQPDGSLEVTDGSDTFVLANRDFNIRSFRSTAVLSWEWRPGSTLFLVWQQARSRELDVGRRAGVDDLLGSVGTAGNNFFAVKVSYWIGF
ncbi:MAG TPA: DUF5916 domain-containing protein, partial [Longimicrobiales bacterium]|nr:DUF5916 domain-containing protein [Longimicrobiales bacterium]